VGHQKGAVGTSRKAAHGRARSVETARKHKTVQPASKAATGKGARGIAGRKAAGAPSSKSKAQELKEKGRLKKQREQEKVAKSRELDRLRRQKEAERVKKQRDIERLKKQRDQEAARAARAKDAQQRLKEDEKKKKLQEREAKRQAELRAREDERRRQLREREDAKRAKEDERQRQKAERDAEREQARRQKEEERAQRDAEREAYRKAKEAERERIRATREAQKRALEGRIAEATRNANKLGGGRSTTTRFYSPRAIPNQSGTTRRVMDASSPTPLTPGNGSLNLEELSEDQDMAAAVTPPLSSEDTPRVQPPPERPLPTPESVEERYRIIEERLKEAPGDFRHNYQEALDMSWIYHDSALEGVVYTFQELRAAIDQGSSAIADSSLQPVVEEVRRHKSAIDLVRELGEKKRAPITVDVIRKI
jgi:chemotaxis protein histidine kinase CheA